MDANLPTENNKTLGMTTMLQLESPTPLYDSTSNYQRIQVFQTKTFGKTLVLDNVLQVTERDEASYQETITHVPMFSHPEPHRVLVIGGGDGGVVREVLRHDSVEHVTLCEIDDMVINVAKQFFPSMACQLENEKAHIIIQDAAAYIRSYKDQKFDVIIIDSSDPIGPNASLFTPQFYRDLRKVLADGGIVCKQAESFWFFENEVVRGYQFAKTMFPFVEYFSATVPSYGGMIGFFLMHDTEITVRSNETLCSQLSCYSSETHPTLFSLPRFIQQKLTCPGKAEM